MILTNMGNVCPTCGKKFFATPPLVPNTKDRDFYGGRIKFFKDVVCDCEAEYTLCIEQKPNHKEGKTDLNVIDMIIVKTGIPKAEMERIAREEHEKKVEQEANEKIHELFESGRVPTMAEREAIKKDVILANIIGLDEKVANLCMHTLTELQLLCKANKVDYPKKANKKELAKLLLIKDPNMVRAD